VPIGNFVTRTAQPKVSELDRVDGRRRMMVKADVQEGVLANDKVKEFQAALPDLGLDPRISLEFKGEDEDQREAGQFLMRAFAVALFVMAGGKGLTRDPMRSGDGGGDPNHSVDNAVMLVGGRAGGLVSGQHVNVTGSDLHHATVINTAMRAVGVDASLGEISGTVDELFG